MPRVTNLQNLAAGIPAEDDRLLLGLGMPLTNGLHARTAILQAPPGYVGEVTLLSGTSIQVNPFRAIIAGTQTITQGDYRVVNDAVLTRAIAPSDPTLGRIDLLVTHVRDTAYVPNEGVDDVQYARVIPGVPAAVPVAPDTPPNALVHGTITVPAAGGAVTFTPAPFVPPVFYGRYWGYQESPNAADWPGLAQGASYGDILHSRWHECAFMFGTGATWKQVNTSLMSSHAAMLNMRTAVESRGGILHNGFRIHDATTDRSWVADGATPAGLWPSGGRPGNWLSVFDTIASGWTVTGSYSNLSNGMARVYVEATKTGTALTVPADGNVGNIAICNITGSWHAEAATALVSGATGRTANGMIGTGSRAVTLAACAPGANIAIGETISLTGVYPLLDPQQLAS